MHGDVHVKSFHVVLLSSWGFGKERGRTSGRRSSCRSDSSPTRSCSESLRCRSRSAHPGGFAPARLAPAEPGGTTRLPEADQAVRRSAPPQVLWGRLLREGGTP